MRTGIPRDGKVFADLLRVAVDVETGEAFMEIEADDGDCVFGGRPVTGMPVFTAAETSMMVMTPADPRPRTRYREQIGEGRP